MERCVLPLVQPCSFTSTTSKEEPQKYIDFNKGFYEDKDVYAICVPAYKKITHHVSLLLLVSSQAQKTDCFITNMRRLLSFLTNHNWMIFYCDYCFLRFSEERRLSEHIPHSTPCGEQKTRVSTENETCLSLIHVLHGSSLQGLCSLCITTRSLSQIGTISFFYNWYNILYQAASIRM